MIKPYVQHRNKQYKQNNKKKKSRNKFKLGLNINKDNISFRGRKMDYLIYGVGRTDYPSGRKYDDTSTPHHMQK